MLRIKAEPELQHVLQHMRMAIDQLADGFPEAAKMEMLSIEGLVQYDTLAEQESYSHGSLQSENEKGPVPRETESPAQKQGKQA